MIVALVSILIISGSWILVFTGYFLWWLWKERRERKRLIQRLKEN